MVFKIFNSHFAGFFAQSFDVNRSLLQKEKKNSEENQKESLQSWANERRIITSYRS